MASRILEGFVSGLPKGDYRIYVIAREPDGRPLDAAPFGDRYEANGVEQRIEPIGPRGPRYVARLNAAGIAHEARDAGGNALEDIRSIGPPKGVTLVGRAHVEGDTLRLAFSGPKGPTDHETIAEDYDGRVIFRAVTAGYRNTLGSYKVSPGGKIYDVTIHFPDATEVGWGGKLVPGKSDSPLSVKAGERVGFFIIADGYNKNDRYRGIDLTAGHFEFRNADGTPATLESLDPSLWYIAPSGAERRLQGRKYHTAAGIDGLGYGLNPDHIAHTVRSVDVDRGELTLGFEDMYNGGDRDFDDSVFTVDIGRGNALVLDPHVPNETIATYVPKVDAAYVAAVVAERVEPFDIDHLKDLIAQLLNDIVPAAGLVKFADAQSPGPFHGTNNHGQRSRVRDHDLIGGFGSGEGNGSGGDGTAGDGDGTGNGGDGSGGDGTGGDGSGGDGDGWTAGTAQGWRRLRR